MAYDNTNSGIMARNERRQTDKHPEFTGSINVEGRDYWLSAWVNEGRTGSKLEGKRYFSIKINPKDAQGNSRPAPSRQNDSMSDDFDDIPFN